MKLLRNLQCQNTPHPHTHTKQTPQQTKHRNKQTTNTEHFLMIVLSNYKIYQFTLQSSDYVSKIASNNYEHIRIEIDRTLNNQQSTFASSGL